MRYTLDDLREADVVYALRMQHERMDQAFVPSLREYASVYQINGRRLGPRQVLMHPGPVNRGVELSGEVVDSPQAVITAQVEAGVVVRMAVLYEVLAGAREPRPRRPSRSSREAPMTARLVPPTAARTADLLVRGAHVLDPREGIDGVHDVLVRDGRIAEIGAPGSAAAPDGAEVVDGQRPAPAAGLRRPARAPAHARPGAQGGPRDRHARGRRGRLLRRRRDAQHRPRRRLARRSCARCTTPPPATRASRSASCRRSRAGCRATS